MSRPERPPTAPGEGPTFRFFDTPGIAPLLELPLTHCDTCDGVGITEATGACPDCGGIGGGTGHAVALLVPLVDAIDTVVREQVIVRALRRAAKDGQPLALDTSDLTAYLAEHSPCYLKALMYAVRLLVHRWVPDDLEGPVVQKLARTLQGDFSESQLD